jgi:hypothetical protein
VSATATGMLNVCRSQLGFVEGPNNDTKYGIWYGANHEPYCAMGLSWCGAAAGATDILLGRYAYCPYWVTAWQHAGQWISWDRTPYPGDIVFFDWTGGHGLAEHVGIVESANAGVLTTIEFNTSIGSGPGGCYRRRRDTSVVAGYGRPKYLPQTSPVPVPNPGPRPPVPLIVDGVWGPATTGRLQMWLGLTPTGVIDVATRVALQRRLGVGGDGLWGPITHRALQRMLGVEQDGIWGPETVRALQRFLNGSK